MKLKLYPDSILSQVTEKVTEFDDELEDKIEEMFEILEEHKGIGLAAPQVGLSESFFVIKFKEMKYTFINPIIEEASGTQTFVEGCLSFPNIYTEVERPARVKIRYQDLEGEEQTLDTEDDNILAQIIQHENDHLQGRTFMHYMSTIDLVKQRKNLKLLCKIHRKEEQKNKKRKKTKKPKKH